jgi:hypothetical protein
MLPQVVTLLDKTDSSIKLSSQYITIMEVGGAYAHLFFPLLDFLELKSVVITDIDSVRKNEKNKWQACLVHEGELTSNACIRHWFSKENDKTSIDPKPDVTEEADELINGDGSSVPTIATILAAASKEKVTKNRRLAYQVPEQDGGPCGRTFEDAFILANRALFGLPDGTNEELAAEARAKAEKQKKSAFALTYAIKKPEWVPPRYIRDGMLWLAEPATVDIDPGLALLAQSSAMANLAATEDSTVAGGGQ